MPHHTGHGSAIRAGLCLEALARDFTISLIVLPINRENSFSKDESFARHHCRSVWRPTKLIKPNWGTVHSVFPRIVFDALHVFRLVTASYLNDLLLCEPRPFCGLDLDDYESFTRLQISRLCGLNGDWGAASVANTDSSEMSNLEDLYLPLFDRVFVANPLDVGPVLRRSGHKAVFAVPNGIRISDCAEPPARLQYPGRQPLTLLFTGTMDYKPNEDAVCYFCAHILPLIKNKLSQAVRFVIVGTRPSQEVRRLAAGRDIDVVGEVRNVARYYSLADLIVVPLRAGGGTRIKILEAFAFRRPVVATSAGAEGLQLRSGEQILLADSVEAFAEGCVRLIRSPAQAAQLAQRAYLWVCANHTLNNIAASLKLGYWAATNNCVTE